MYSYGLRVVIVNGAPCSGKSTFEHMCQDILGYAYCQTRSTVDKVKEIAVHCGWDGVKTPKNRKFLSDLKDLLTEYNDLPFTDILQFVKGWEDDLSMYHVGDKLHILFVDDREPEHIERLKKELHATTLLIKRDIAEQQPTSNHADENVFNYDYDVVIQNNGSLEHLKYEAQAFINYLFSV